MLRARSIGPGVEGFAARTPTLPPATETQSYALGSREVLLVEPATPYPDEQRAWLEWARALAAQGRRATALFLTHHHPDHVGGAEVFARELGLPLWMHAETAARLPELETARRLTDGDVIVLDGPTPQRWRVLHTPGHAPGHLCLWEEASGELVVGDMVASEGTILIAPGEGDMAEYLRQLARLEALGARRALPAHGAPILEPSRLFAAYARHRLEREAKVLGALRAAGPAGATPAELVPRAYDDAPAAVWPLAEVSLRAHLAKLVEDGVARAVEQRYSAA
ncbi:MAG: MBL fold metallo-hydrolase [Sorangiineae bacterium]|nr:MBL fold metallo-hydrolase [Polyangiaceae bacterium]MEB2322365.1 MBL fold metallo-hydrolase [Sorangiineae bacterium]